jgi:hypothetical protein
MEGGQKGRRFSVLVVGAATGLALLVSDACGQGVTIQLEGEIPASCRLETAGNQINLGELAGSGQTAFAFRVRCNTPFHLSLVSQHGALATNYNGLLRPGFIAVVPYQVAVNIPTSTGSIAGVCSSAALTGAAPSCQLPNSQNGIALTGEASLTLGWQTGGNVPIAGTYTDLLTLSISPRI